MKGRLPIAKVPLSISGKFGEMKIGKPVDRQGFSLIRWERHI
jgi:hypothetical protein